MHNKENATNLSNTGTPEFVEAARRRYQWVDVEEDGSLNATLQARVINFGRYETKERETTFRVIFSESDIIKDGKECWPLDGGYGCAEDPYRVSRFAKKALFYHEKGAKYALYKGRYQHGPSPEFVLDSESPTHVLFVTDKGLRACGGSYNCDVIMTHECNAVAMPIAMAEHLIANRTFL